MTPASSKSRGKPKASQHILVTAGPTREYVDPVRFLSNESSGKMGFAIASQAARAGHRVTLIAGPVHQETPDGVERVDVVSARDMLAATRKAFREADALFMAAAVADFRPKRRLGGKWRKKDDGSEEAILELVKNPDILATVSRGKGQRLVVGFALETGDGLRRARRKLVSKGADYIVLNDASALNASVSTVTIVGERGNGQRLGPWSKDRLARALLKLLTRASV